MKNAIAEDRLRLPSFDCPNPNCTAKNIAFAPSAEAKNKSELVPIETLEEINDAEFIVNCPKCKRQFALIRHQSYPVIPLELIPYISFVTTY